MNSSLEVRIQKKCLREKYSHDSFLQISLDFPLPTYLTFIIKIENNSRLGFIFLKRQWHLCFKILWLHCYILLLQ